MAKTLLDILEQEGIELQQSGDRHKAYCPFHKDDTPSFTIYPNGTYYCFGVGCEVWGDVVKFLVEYKGMTAQESLNEVGADYKQPRAEKSKVIKVKSTTQTWAFLDAVTHDYHDFLMGIPGAVNYLLSRGLKMETIRKYRIGYTDGGVLNLTFAWERQLADEVGLMNRKGYETLAHRITIPNTLEKGQVDFIMGRTIIHDKVKYLGLRMPKPLMGFYEIRQSPIIFMVEGQFDWLTLRQWGYPAICLSGTNPKGHELIALVDKEIVYVPDLDDGPGMKAANNFKARFGDKLTILDYSELRPDDDKMDISRLAENPDGEELFKQVVMEKLPWITLLSKGQQKKWFPHLVGPMFSPLT